MFSTPKAYFITFRTYGTWLHGDDRGSVDRIHNAYGTPQLEPGPGLQAKESDAMPHQPVMFTSQQRVQLTEIFQTVCDYKNWFVHAINVRTNHVHIVVTAPERPEQVMNALKAWATRRLRETAVIETSQTLWARHGSTKYLWDDKSLWDACRYTAESQQD